MTLLGLDGSVSHLPASVLILSFSDHYQKHQGSQAWWHIPVIPVLGSLRQEVGCFDASLGYIVSSRPAWATKWHPVSKIKKEKEIRKYPYTWKWVCSSLECGSGQSALQLPETYFPRPGFPRQTCDTQRGKGFWGGTLKKKKKVPCLSPRNTLPLLRVLCKSEVANTEPWPFQPVLNPIIAQLYRAIFKEKTQVRFI